MKNFFEKQLKSNLPIKEEDFTKIKTKTYFNGEEIQIGDIVLFAVMLDEPVKTDVDDVFETRIELIKLNERHFDLFTVDEKRSVGCLPTIKLNKKRIENE